MGLNFHCATPCNNSCWPFPAVLARKSEKTVRCSVSKSAQNISLLFNLCLCVHSTQSRPVASISKLNMPLKSTKKACHFLGGRHQMIQKRGEFGELELDQISRSQTSVHGPDLKAKACLSTSRETFHVGDLLWILWILFGKIAADNAHFLYSSTMEHSAYLKSPIGSKKSSRCHAQYLWIRWCDGERAISFGGKGWWIITH